jgi:hypothetical protein
MNQSTLVLAMTSPAPEDGRLYLFMAVALIVYAVWLLAKAVAPFRTVLMVALRAAMACVMVGVALTVVAIVLLNQ